MLIAFFTNCQGEFIYKNWLQDLEPFRSGTNVFVPNYGPDLTDLHKRAIRECDVFIYQPTNKYTIGENSEDDLLATLKPSCIRICFPSLYISIWPLYEEHGKYIGRDVIEGYKCLGYSLGQILYMYDAGELHFNLQNRFQKSWEHLKKREDLYCNIKVADFILGHYKTHRLFDTQNHPNGVIGSYVAKEICRSLHAPFPPIDIFSQQDIHIDHPAWMDNRYMRAELGLEFISDDEYGNYRVIIIDIYKSAPNT